VDAIGVEGIPVAAWNELVASESGDLHISCRRYGTGVWSCLGFLNARDLVAMAWTEGLRAPRNIFVYHSHCRECRPAVAESLEREIMAANLFLARFGSGEILSGEKPPLPESETKAINRRSFFSSLLSTGVETARNVMWPEDGAVPLPKARDRAQRLRDRKDGALDEAQELFPALSIAPNCIACGLCIKICPVQALTAIEKASSLEVWQEPLLCTSCGLCAAHCPTQSITLVPKGIAAKQKLIVQDFPRCNECGEFFKPAGLQLTCFECLLKGRQSIFGP
jgi:ferredoxin